MDISVSSSKLYKAPVTYTGANWHAQHNIGTVEQLMWENTGISSQTKIWGQGSRFYNNSGYLFNVWSGSDMMLTIGNYAYF